jgi:hypothetical protein
MKKLLTAVAAFAALSFATPAQAYVSQADIAATKGIIQKLRSIGVTINTPSQCINDLAGEYSHSTSTLTVCPAAMASEALLIETVAHEAVHAAQHCVGGAIATVNGRSANENAKLLIDMVGDKFADVARVTEGLSPAARVREYEAYGLEDSPATVLSILNKVCP